jgi:hypothetical protein
MLKGVAIQNSGFCYSLFYKLRPALLVIVGICAPSKQPLAVTLVLLSGQSRPAFGSPPG